MRMPDMRTAAPSVALEDEPTPLLPSLSVVIPVHDEEGAIADVLAAVERVAGQVAGEWEIVVVDDGSGDGTPALLRGVAAREPRIRVVRHESNRGYGAALRSGFAAARFAWVFFTDGDGQLDPGQLPDAVEALGDADGVVGYRLRRSDSLARRVNTALWNRLVRVVLDVPVRDLNCAFKLLPRHVLAPEGLRARGAVISAEILARAARAGCRFVEIPVVHRPRRRGRPSGARPGVVFRAAWELPRLCWRLRREGAA
jgi:glycosyltransferase involved in cell wall biosynthesis